MTNKTFQKKAKYLILVIVVFSFLSPTNSLHAQGPNAPEAASFEPVDATDMVNLVTGDLSYVLPLLNVPSPEGGYPIALSYHAGIAMEQDASWVGLGWSLNPGTINRGVNGYPDDWKETRVREFFYDQGWEEEYYSISGGITLGGGISVGLGVSWGSNQSLGGYVSASIGFDDGSYGSPSIGVRIGTNGFSIYGGVAGFNASAGTDGVGIGYGTKGDTSIGVSLNYSYNSGLSGGVSVSRDNGFFKNAKGEKIAEKTSGIGISFGSNGASFNAKVNGLGAGISTSNNNISGRDYDVDVKSSGFVIPAIIFYVGFNKTKVKYSLYKYNDLYVAGMGYPYYANRAAFPEENSFATLLDQDRFMDVNTISKFDGSMVFDELLDVSDRIEKNNLMLPNYDNYTLTAQGLSGSIKPISYQELNLSARGRNVRSNEESYGGYLNLNNNKGFWIIDTHDEIELERNLFFYFDNTYSSFLRTERSDIIRIPDYSGDTSAPTTSRYAFTQFYGTTPTNNFSSDVSPNGETLQRPYSEGYKRRTGNTVVTYTNKQIRDSYQNGISNLFGFIDATEYKVINNTSIAQSLDRTDTNTYLDESIGAYTVTTIDGKVYHYSLPVYNFEHYYKNYKNENNEDKNFFEISKQKPYATHWLLTGITGPDYIDTNNNGKMDKEDYGYWINFDYGKWSDGYAWKTPIETIKDNEKLNEADYSYAWGRKQIYYLDAIKTRTHTALFVKSLRDDNLSATDVNANKALWSPGTNFNWNTYAKKYNKNRHKYLTSETFYADTGEEVETVNQITTDNCNINLFARETSYKYVQIPTHRTLKLDKILLLKNEDISIEGVKNSTNAILASEKGYITTTNGYSDFYYVKYDKNPFDGTPCDDPLPPLGFTQQVLYSDNISNLHMKEFDIHQSQNVLDINDIDGLNIEHKAEQVIELNYNYSLAKSSPRSQDANQGRLTLSTLGYNGKSNIAMVPPYKFKYNKDYIHFDNLKINDWGYHVQDPQAWSLSEIQTPTGGKINISYEKDIYTTAINNYFVFKNKSERFPAIALHEEIKEYINGQFIWRHNPMSKSQITINASEVSNAEDIGMDGVLTVNIGDKLFVDYVWYRFDGEKESTWPYHYINQVFDKYTYKGWATVTAIIPGDKYEIDFDTDVTFESSKTFHSNFVDYSDPFFPENFMEEKSENRFNNLPNEDKLSEYRIKLIKEIDGVHNSGGIRTKNISISDGINTILKTEYVYTKPETNETSGITPYSPFSLQQNVVPYVSELPPPSAKYSNVAIENYDGNGSFLGKTTFEFENLEPLQQETGCLFSLGDAFKVKENQNETFENDLIHANKYTFHNKLSNIGRILSTKNYNAEGQVLNETRNQYRTNLDNDGEIGVTQESYKSLKYIVNNDAGTQDYFISSTSKINYPSVLENTTNIQSGFKITINNNKHDFLTGQVLETITTDSKGNEFTTELTPAYTKTQYNPSGGYGMGSKVDDQTNKNMLSQETMTKTYIKIGDDWKETSIGITTWNNEWDYINYDNSVTLNTAIPNDEKIWRKHKNYVWDGATNNTTGIYEDFTGDDDNFNWDVGQNITQTNSKWKNTSTTTLYDHYSMPLEVKDINNNYASTKMCDDNSKVMAVCNAAYNDMFYSGGEYYVTGSSNTYFDGQVGVGDGYPWNYYGLTHTGDEAITIDANKSTFIVNPGKTNKYKAFVWALNKPSGFVPTHYSHLKLKVGSTLVNYNSHELVHAGQWVLLSFDATINAGQEVSIVANGSYKATLDDFKLHPVASSMTSYVYNEWDELTYMIASNNLATKYEYDEGGRLVKTYTEIADEEGVEGGFKLITHSRKFYKNQ